MIYFIENMMYQYILTVLFILFFHFTYAQSDHEETTGYLDYFVSTYNTYEVLEEDSAVFYKSGAYINKNEVYLDYQVEIDPQKDFEQKEDFYAFLMQTIQTPLKEDAAFELQIYAVHYALTINYYFEDNSFLRVEKRSISKQKALYFDKNKRVVKQL
ncbi:hypothetical protein [Flammeovirga sp. EKP202]|uniref:hypothetical protein n=1 Tax=Flammeovirga sp. EKP202 TaxID=2770592 RepID=UPI00165EF6A3|nr:hypothetical protein [Flammeovirga sp. EKP202]MBD0404375.1 hypothetical protein [Flammeovirga sp. EKP202]